MPISIADALALGALSFNDLPDRARAHAMGVTYAHIRTPSGDDLYLTKHGWPWLRELLPENWYADRYFRTHGERLRFSSGTVYRVPIVRPRLLPVVVKFSRVGQHLDSRHLVKDAPSVPEQRSFGSPFEEIAMLERLRCSTIPPRVLTKRPLAVFSPCRRYKEWQLGRIAHEFEHHVHRLQRASRKSGLDESITLEPLRDYIIIFHWMRGLNLEECCERGILDHATAEGLSRTALRDLRAKGFEVLDHKPNHVIVCVRGDGSLLRRHGRVVYGIADFELLVAGEAPGLEDNTTPERSCERESLKPSTML